MVQSVSRAIDVLEALVGADELGLTDLGERTGLRPSTAHRLLATLAARGYVIQSPDSGRYALSFKLLELSSTLRERSDRLRSLARPRLETIQRLTGETANLTVVEGRQAVYVDQVASTKLVRIFTQVGRSVPAHTTGAGKAVLAYRGDEAIERLYAHGPLERLTNRTITDLDQLKAELRRVRGRGYAVDREEHEQGVTCIAAAILDDDGTARAAISVSGLTTRLLRTEQTDLGELLSMEAREISQALGYAGESG